MFDYIDDFPVVPAHQLWTDTGVGFSIGQTKIYVVQTTTKVSNAAS